jgi:septal ring-binding cell division protein DamX
MAKYSEELFPELEKDKRGKRKFPREFKLVHERYVKLSEEKIAFLVLLFLGVGIGGYLLGYKIGVEKSTVINYTPSGQTESLQGSAKNNQSQVVVTQKTSSPQQDRPRYRYLIQLVAYKNRDYAEAERKKLQRQGYDVIIKNAGKWSIVYAGYYDHRQEAEKDLSKLRKEYRDAFIKKVKGGQDG